MQSRLQPYVARKLRKALDWVERRPSRHEGLYSAYEESLQWLEDLDDLPPPVNHVLHELRGTSRHVAAEIRSSHVRKRIAAMSQADVCVLIARLETALQSVPRKVGC